MPLRPPTAFIVKAGTDGKVVIFTTPALDALTVHAVAPVLNRVVEENGAGRLRLDFSQVEYLSGAALGRIVAMSQKVTDAGGELLLRNLGEFPLELFQITRLDRVLNVRRKRAPAT